MWKKILIVDMRFYTIHSTFPISLHTISDGYKLFQPVTDALLRGVQFTHFCAKNMIEGTPFLEAFK